MKIKLLRARFETAALVTLGQGHGFHSREMKPMSTSQSWATGIKATVNLGVFDPVFLAFSRLFNEKHVKKGRKTASFSERHVAVEGLGANETP